MMAAAGQPTIGPEESGDDVEQQVYDVVVVGGGAAGLSGALVLSRARRSVLVVDSGEPRNAPAAGVHNYLGREGAPPGELLAAGRGEVTGYGGQVVTGTVTTVERLEGSPDRRPGGPCFRVALDGGRAVLARRLLVTTGVVDQLPDVPGLAERWGIDVLHCPYCHGREVADQAIGVVGTGPMAVHQALLWRQWSGDVTLFLHTAPEPTKEQWEQLAARGIAVVDGKVAGLDISGGRLSGVRLASGPVVPRQAVATMTQVTARAEVLTSLGLGTTDMEIGGVLVGRRVPATANGATEVAGVWVAGNVTDPLAQVITAAGGGLAAAAAINTDLIAEDTAVAVAAHRSGDKRAGDRKGDR